MYLLIVSIHLLFLTHDSQQHCSDGKPKDCLEAEFAPGTTLGGEGFDITKMEPKGAYVIDMNQWKRKDKTCTLCSNPFLENKKQKLPLSVVDWRPKQSCSAKVSSQLHKSSESLVSSSTASIQNNWKVNLDVNVAARSGKLMLAGTNSKMADYSMEKTKNDKYSFSSQSMFCEFYRYRITNSPKLHRDFRQALNKLPKAYNAGSKQQFYGLIEKFGTHYVTKVHIGGSITSVTSIRDCEASLQGLSVEEVQACLEVEASASFSSAVSVQTEAKHCKSDIQKSDSKSSFSSSFNDRFTEIKGGHNTEPDLLFSADKDPSAYKDWLGTLPQHPDIVSYSLDPLHELLPAQAPTRSNLRSAISHYILERGLWRNCSSLCPVGVRTDPRDPCVCQCHNAAVNTDCCPSERGLARVVITVQRAEGLWGDHTTATDAFVKVYRGKTLWRSRVIWNNNNPYFRYVIDWGNVNILSENKVRFEVWDEDNKYDDDLLGVCERSLSVGVKDDVCNLQRGRLFFKWHVQCAPNLGGSLCKDYKPAPMNPTVKGRFKSRHAHPIPEALLQDWGVFINRSKSNHTLEE